MTDKFKDATPRPWRARSPDLGYSGSPGVFGPDGKAICYFGENALYSSGIRGCPEDGSNKALVVLAVNAYEPMREALTKLRPFVEEDFPPDAPDAFATPAYADAYRAMVRALRAANGES